MLFKTTKARKWPSGENQKFFVVQATRSENVNISNRNMFAFVTEGEKKSVKLAKNKTYIRKSVKSFIFSFEVRITSLSNL